MAEILALIVIILLIYYFWTQDEGFKSCNDYSDCPGRSIGAKSLAVLNPFFWPYSGSACPSDAYDPPIGQLHEDPNASPIYPEYVDQSGSQPDHSTDSS